MHSSFIAGSAYLALPRAPETWIIDQILPTAGLLNIYGPPKAGKTYAALDLAMAVSDPAREKFLEWEVRTHGPAWYLQLDTPRGLFHTQYLESVVAAGHCINGISFADTEMTPYPFNALMEGREWLKAAIQGAQDDPPAVLVVDTLRDAHGSDENDSGVLRNVVSAFVDATRIAGVRAPALVFLTHEKKLDPNMPINLMAGNRGSNYLAGRMDGVMRVAAGEIMAQSRTLQLTTLSGYERNHVGLWTKFDENAEIARYVAMPFHSPNARHKAFHEQWKHLSFSTVEKHFKNFTERGSFDKHPPPSEIAKKQR